MITQWICGKRINDLGAWEFQGVFTTEDLASEACVNRSYFIGPVLLNKQYPDGSAEWPGAYFPLEADGAG
jgi:hypothetical protein